MKSTKMSTKRKHKKGDRKHKNNQSEMKNIISEIKVHERESTDWIKQRVK